jgi:hypothetical protein
MSIEPDDLVRERTRVIVGHQVLRRASLMVQGWQAEAHENTRLAKQITSGLLIFAVISLSVFFLF